MQPNKIDKKLEQAIVNSRKKLVSRDTEATRYAFCGAIAIHQELNHSGYRTKPSLSTINRVLKRNGLIVQQSKTTKKNASGTYYPEIQARHPGHVHQLDLVTPRYIKGYGVIISVNRIDVCTGQANLEQYDSKSADSVIDFLIDDWKVFGMPRYLQIDNEAAFRGSLYHPRTFGKVSRFCLNFGVELVFIAFKEPWRNAYIESFNSRFDRLLWQSQRFTDLEHLKTEAKKFRDKHNKYQEYRKQNFSTQKLQSSYTQRFLPRTFVFDVSRELPITKGRLHFLRFLDEKGCINILNETIYVETSLSFQYVWAIVNTADESLQIYYQASREAPKQLLKTESYKLREPVKNKVPISKLSKV